MKFNATLITCSSLLFIFLPGCKEKPLPVNNSIHASFSGPDTSGWAAQAFRIIEEQEYAIRYNESSKAYSSPNRRQDMSAAYSGNMMTLQSGPGLTNGWKLRLQLHGIYAGGSQQYGIFNLNTFL